MSQKLKLGESKRDVREVKTAGVPTYPNLKHEKHKETSNRKDDMETYKTPANVRDYLGIFTLLLLGTAGVLGAYKFRSHAYWVQVPYYATIIGSYGGAIWEIFGDLNGRWADTVTSWRGANVGIVAGSILCLFIRLGGYARPTGWQLILLVSTIGSFLFSNSFLQQQQQRGALTSIAVFVSCILMAIFPSAEALISRADSYYMIAFAGSLLLAFFALNFPDPRQPKQDPNLLLPEPTPPNFALFHLINAIGSFVSLYGLRNLKAPGGVCLTCCEWEAIAAGIVFGGAINFIRNPLAVAEFLNIPSGFVWNFILRELLSQKPWEPEVLPKFKPQERILTKVYYETHPHTRPLSCPSAVIIPPDQQKDFKKIKGLFGIIGKLDVILPRARLVPLKDKPRMKKKQLSQYYWNPVLVQHIVPIQTTPTLARQYYDQGQFLQYLVWFAHCSNMIRKADPQKGETQYGTHVMDFEYMRKYQYKEDYHPYGGKCFFELKDEGKDKDVRLDVRGVMAPGSSTFIKRKADDWKFRQIEQILSASAFFEVVAGLHLLGIHVMMNTVPIALHNAFDLSSWAGGSGYHPYRVALNLHFFNHIFVNELTTAHLLAETSVFPQIFATTHSGLCEYLNDRYQSFEYAKDAKLEERKAVVNNQFPKSSQLAVEEQLIKVFRLYGTEVVDAIYKSDKEVAEDKAIQNLRVEMDKLVHLGLPERFNFKTKEGIALFYAESAYVVTVRHEIYGTKATFPGMDPSIMNGQVPRDFGPDAVDVYNSILWVGLATAQAKFANLQQDFKRLLKAVDDDNIREGIGKAYDNFQYRLSEIQQNSQYDYAHLRVLPIHLETGAGY